MKTLSHTEFTALLDRADVRQAAFARLTGVTARQVNNWCRGRTAVPRWAAILAIVLQDLTPDSLEIGLTKIGARQSESPPVPHQGHDPDRVMAIQSWAEPQHR